MPRTHPPGPAVQRRRAFVRAGFSLAELVVVVAVMAITAAVVMPRWGGAVARRRVDAAASRIAADFRLARAHAKAASTETFVEFSDAKQWYIIAALPDVQSGAGQYTVLLGEDPYRVSITAVDFKGESGPRFNAFGYLLNEGEVTIAAGDHARTVALVGPSGEITIR